jgi:hypothetical protein
MPYSQQISPEQILGGGAITYGTSSPLGGVSIPTGSTVPGSATTSGQLLVFTNSSGTTYTLPASAPSTWNVSLFNNGTGTVTVAPPGGASLNGSSSSIALAPGQGTQIFTNGAGGFFTQPGSGTATGTATPPTPILDSSGNPILDSAGNWIFL